MQNSNIYNAIVVGDNPDDLMALYDVAKKCDKYIKYYYRDALYVSARPFHRLGLGLGARGIEGGGGGAFEDPHFLGVSALRFLYARYEASISIPWGRA